ANFNNVTMRPNGGGTFKAFEPVKAIEPFKAVEPDNVKLALNRGSAIVRGCRRFGPTSNTIPAFPDCNDNMRPHNYNTRANQRRMRSHNDGNKNTGSPFLSSVYNPNIMRICKPQDPFRTKIFVRFADPVLNELNVCMRDITLSDANAQDNE
ncbi:hypothetical protein BG004_008117, partial [Podila humilis]